MRHAHLCFPERGSCSHTIRSRPPVTHRWSPLPVVHAAKQRILGASGQVREARYRHWGSENTRGTRWGGKRRSTEGNKVLSILSQACIGLSPSQSGAGNLWLHMVYSATHNLASSLHLPHHSRSQLGGLLSGEHNLLPRWCCCDWSVWTSLLW